MKIATSRGLKEARELRPGDIVAGKSGWNKVVKVEKWSPDMIDDFFKVYGRFTYYLINNKYKFYKEQSIVINNGFVTHAKNLKKGDLLIDQNGNLIEIFSIKKASSPEWYRFTIDGDHTYVGDGILLHNASRFWVGGGSSTNWNATSNTNWSASSGGANNATVPGSSDTATFDGAGASGNGNSIVSAVITVGALTFTSGYTATVTVNASITCAGNFTDHTAHSWAGSAILQITTSSTITSNGQTWPNQVVFSGSGATKTLVGNWVIGGVLTVQTNAQIINHTTSETITAAGYTSSAAASGTIDVILSGGTWSGSAAITFNSLTFAGNVTVSGGVAFNTGSLIYSSGTVTTTSSTLTIAGATTLDTYPIAWNAVTCILNVTLTINSTLICTIFNGGTTAKTFAGTAGFDIGTFNLTATTAVTASFANTVTYVIRSALNASNAPFSARPVFSSDHATNRAIFNVYPGATINTNASFTRIDATPGRPILTWNGTVSDCLNVFSFTNVQVPPECFKIKQRGSRRKMLANSQKSVIYQ